MLADLIFLSPWGGLLAVLALAPLAAYLWTAGRARQGRKLLGLAAPERSRPLLLVLLIAVPLLLGLAAARPALRSSHLVQVRTDAQAVFVFDISRSMLASARRGAPTRLAQATGAAIQLRNQAIPDVPSGVATFTTLMLPHLFPDRNAALFDSTVTGTVAVEQPAPPYLAPGFPGTSFSALEPLRNQGYFSPFAKKRVAILLTDGESGPYSLQTLANDLVGSDYSGGFGGQSSAAQPPVSLLVVQIGQLGDRIYDRDGSIEAAYRPDPQAGQILDALAAATRAQVFPLANLGGAATALKQLVGTGPVRASGRETTTVLLAPWIVLVALVGVLVIVLRRTFVAL